MLISMQKIYANNYDHISEWAHRTPYDYAAHPEAFPAKKEFEGNLKYNYSGLT